MTLDTSADFASDIERVELSAALMFLYAVGAIASPFIASVIIEAFGPHRAMFASNFPVDGLCGSFDTIFNGFKAATAGLLTHDRLALFHDTAIRVYRLGIPLAAT